MAIASHVDGPNNANPLIAPPTYEAAIASLEIVPKLRDCFTGAARYRCSWGGRGSGKSRTFALMSAVRGYYQPIRILCTREIQNSIKDSVLKEIVRAIDSVPWLRSHYSDGETFIRGKNGTEYIFKGLRHNYTEIKSMSGVAICWVEEAERISTESWGVLRPTIREPGSEIWVTWNPEKDDSATQQQFIAKPPRSMKIVECNYRDNPFFPDVLEQERLDCLEAATPEIYQHIWEGKTLNTVNGAIFKYFKRDRHCLRGTIDPTVPIHVSFDFNHSPAVAIAAQLVDGELWILREWYLLDSNTFESADAVTAWIKGLGVEIPVHIHGDASGRQKTANAMQSNWDIVLNAFTHNSIAHQHRVAMANPSIQDTINSCNAALRSNRIAVHPDCAELIRDLETLTFTANGGIDKSDSRRSHLGDCFRYLVHDLLPLRRYTGQSGGAGRQSMPVGVF